LNPCNRGILATRKEEMKFKKWSDMKALEKVFLVVGILMVIAFVIVAYKVFSIPPSEY
jgi:capsule polysaccharide export protein KpsE/RkpR